MDRGRGSDETHAVGRSDITVSPMFDDGQTIVGRNDQSARGVVGLGSDEVLADPGKAIPPQRGNVRPSHGFDPDITSLTDQNRAQADFEIIDLGLPLAQVGEGLREAGSRHDFKQHIGQADLGHAALDVGTQGLASSRVPRAYRAE